MSAERPEGALVGYTTGVFDMFHIGHLNVLRNAKNVCDYLIAGVVSDDLTLARKGKSPVIPLGERIEIVQSIRYVDEVVVEDASKVEMWRRLRYDVMVKGDDWRGTPKGRRLEAEMKPLNVEIVYLPYTAHTSSTLLRQALTGRVASA